MIPPAGNSEKVHSHFDSRYRPYLRYLGHRSIGTHPSAPGQARPGKVDEQRTHTRKSHSLTRNDVGRQKSGTGQSESWISAGRCRMGLVMEPRGTRNTAPAALSDSLYASLIFHASPLQKRHLLPRNTAPWRA
ncbi:hypothetical protein CaCOL14_000119 [Colletotrichum acutatum]